MADKFTANRQQTFLTGCHQTIEQAPSQVQQLAVTLGDCNANWAGYAAIEDDQQELAAAGQAFGAKVGAAWTTAKPHLETALDVLAGGMGVSRNDLLGAMETE